MVEKNDTSEAIHHFLWVEGASASPPAEGVLPKSTVFIRKREGEVTAEIDPLGQTIVAVVAAPTVEHPARLGRILARKVPGAPLIFLCRGRGCDRLRAKLKPALLGSRYRVLEETRQEELAALLQKAVVRSARRQHFRTTLDRVNLQLRDRHTADPQRFRRMTISERFLASLLAQTPDAIFSVDLNGYITSWNHAAAEFFGMGGLAGRLLDQAGLGDCTARIRAGIGRCRQEQRLVREEFACRTPGGRKEVDASYALLLDEEGQEMGFSIVLRDVTARKEAAEQLRKKEVQMANIARISPVVISRFDVDGRCIYTNEFWTTLSGLPSEAALGDGWLTVVHPEDRPTVLEAWQGFVRSRAPYLCEFRIVRANESVVWVQSRAAAETDASGATTGFIRISTDITARKEAEEAMREMNRILEDRVRDRTAELEETNAQLETFVYSIAHDLRAPARAISGFLQLVLADHGDQLDEEARDFLERSGTAAERMDYLIQDLLSYSRLSQQEVSHQRVELEPLVARVRAQVREDLALHRAELIVEGELPAVVGHDSTIEQVLINLVSNGAKFVPSDRSPQVRVRAESKASIVRVWVEDNGIGIDRKYYEKIFGVFERLHSQNEFPGTGIGLAIVHKGIERLGGRVGVESRPGQGSRFWFELPVAAPAGEGNAGAE